MQKIWPLLLLLRLEPKIPVLLLFGAVLDACLVAIAETLDTTTGINQFLLTGIKRVAVGAYFDAERAAQRGAGFKGVPAAAGYCYRCILWMDISFHSTTLSKN